MSRTASTNRFFVAILLYGALAASAFFTLEGTVRLFVLILFAGLAIKTWAVHQRERLELQEEQEANERTVPPTG